MMPHTEDAEAEENFVFSDASFLADFIVFLDTIPFVEIKKEAVEKVQHNEFEEEAKKLRDQIVKISNDAEEAKKVAKRHEDATNAIKRDLEKNQREQAELRRLLEEEKKKAKGGFLGKLIGGILAPFTGGASLAIGALVDEMRGQS